MTVTVCPEVPMIVACGLTSHDRKVFAPFIVNGVFPVTDRIPYPVRFAPANVIAVPPFPVMMSVLDDSEVVNPDAAIDHGDPVFAYNVTVEPPSVSARVDAPDVTYLSQVQDCPFVFKVPSVCVTQPLLAFAAAFCTHESLKIHEPPTPVNFK